MNRLLLLACLFAVNAHARRPANTGVSAVSTTKNEPSEEQPTLIPLPSPQLVSSGVEEKNNNSEENIAAPFTPHQLLTQMVTEQPAAPTPLSNSDKQAPEEPAPSSAPPVLETSPLASIDLANIPAPLPAKEIAQQPTSKGSNSAAGATFIGMGAGTTSTATFADMKGASADGTTFTAKESQEIEITEDIEPEMLTKAPVTKGTPSVENEYRNDRDLYPGNTQKKEIYLNFENADLKTFIDYIAEVRGMNIIPDQGVAGSKISLNFRKPVSRDGAWNTFLTVLEKANFSIIKYKNGENEDGKDQFFYRVMPKDKKLRQPLPTFIGIDYNELPDSDATVRYVSFLNNIPIQEVQNLLQTLLSKTSTIIPQQDVNGFVMIDKSNNIKSAMKVIKELDQTSIHETVFVMRLKRANAGDVKSLFDSLITKPDGSPLARLLGKQAEGNAEYFSSGTKIIAEERTNSLIMLGNQKSLEKVREFIVEHIDTELKQAKSPLRIYELQHTNAKEIEEILREVTATDNFQSQAGQQAAKYGAIRGGVKYFKGMNFQSDVEGNRLLISCADDNDWRLLQKTIQQLDAPQPQVAIQMMIVTVNESRVRELGGQMRNKTHNMLGKGIDFQTHGMNKTVFEQTGTTPTSLLGNLINALVLEQGSTVVNLGNAVTGAGENGMWGVLKALSTETDATVLSEPFMTIANRSSSTLVVGDSTYVTTQEAVSGSNATTGYAKEDADTRVTITPQINSDGIIRMEVDTLIEEFIPDSGGTSKQRKTLKTSVTVANGQVLALGGMVKTKITEAGGKTPIFGDIPLLGWLAKSKKRTTEKEYLFLFLCPTILKPRTSPGIGLYTKMKLHKAAGEVEDAIKTTKTNDPIQNWYFNPTGEGYSHKIVDFANARYQPNNVDLRHDPYFRSESAIDIDRRLEVAAESASPVRHWQQRQAARPVAPVKEQPKTPKKQLPLETLPATTQIGPEQVTLASAPETPKMNVQQSVAQEVVPEVKPQSTPVVTPVQTPSLTRQLLTAQTETPKETPQKEDQITNAYLDQQIQLKRDKLKMLLGGNSLGDLLSKTPNHQIVEESAATQPVMVAANKQVSEPAEKQKNVAESFMKSHRQGLRSLLETPDENEAPQEKPLLVGQASQSQKNELRNILGSTS